MNDLACSEYACYLCKAAQMDKTEAEQLFDKALRFFPMMGHWHVVILFRDLISPAPERA